MSDPTPPDSRSFMPGALASASLRFLVVFCNSFVSTATALNAERLSRLTGKTKEELAGELQGVIFRVPGQLEKDGTPHYVTADEYLSGNVRRKLRQAQRAAQQDPVYVVNVEALTAAQPKDLDAYEHAPYRSDDEYSPLYTKRDSLFVHCILLLWSVFTFSYFAYSINLPI